MARILQGKSNQWQLGDTPVGSGDAGEVYNAVCLDMPGIEGVVKKPARVATGGTIQRQAGQIEQEAQALRRLDGLPHGKAHPPRLLDEAPEFTNGTAHYFIVSESAPGEALDAMLTQTRQEDKPFPRRVIITVLDALFDLFSRSHQAGVLWNDVKLDHIYWHNPTGAVTVIDWGNALFLDMPEKASRRTPPRWEDYRQFVDTLGVFLKRSAPELYEDLGWDEFTGTELDLPTISILARRIAYQQEVISLKEMEYRSLINVVLSADPELGGLQTIRSYQNVLEKIGAPWPRQEILAYGTDLVNTLSSQAKIPESLRGTSLMFDLFGETLDLPWHLLREIYRQPDLIAHPCLSELVNQILKQNWAEALWLLVDIGANGKNPTWLDQFTPVLRQKAIGLVTPPPFTICARLREWLRSQNPQVLNTHPLAALNRKDWRNTGEDFHESPFDYSLLVSLIEEPSLPHNLRSQLRESYAAGKKAIRELLQTWVEMNWEELDTKLKQVLAWDPDRWAILNLAESIAAFRIWLKRLFDGPEPGTPALDFLKSMQASRPPVEKVLGQPPWFLSLKQLMSQITSETRTKPSLDAVKNWCPWILTHAELLQSRHIDRPDETEITQALLHFESHLRTWSDIDAGLEEVREKAPGFHPACTQLAEGFTQLLSLNFLPENLNTRCATPPHPALDKACQALMSLVNWRTCLSQGDLAGAAKEVCGSTSLEDWQILHRACELTRSWQAGISPALRLIMEEEAEQIDNGINHQENLLQDIHKGLEDIRQTWKDVYRGGIHLHWLSSLEESSEKVRSLFLTWRNDREQSDDRLERILYHTQLELIRQISSRLLKLSQHIRLARLCLSELRDFDEVRSNIMKTLDNILGHMAVIEAILVQDNTAYKVPDWQSGLNKVRDTVTSEERRKVVLSLSGDHPFYTWLVDSSF